MATYQFIYNLPSIVKFAEERIKGADSFPPNTGSIGLLKNGKLVGAVIYTGQTKTSVLMSVASDGSKTWMTKEFIRKAFTWPFVCLGVNRITGLVRADQPDVIKFDEHVGFKKEGVLRKADDDGTDLVVMGMLKEECRWIKQKEKLDEQEIN